jgi:Family of unknown function (DUF5990)
MAERGVAVRLRIEGHHLPGRRCGPYDAVHVALQVGRDPVDLVPGDAVSAAWEIDLRVVPLPGDEAADVRGPAVQGRRGERFAYLTWGSTAGGQFEMFRRAKLMLGGVPDLVGDGQAHAVTARVHLTGDDGMPRCARLRPPAVEWTPRGADGE